MFLKKFLARAGLLHPVRVQGAVGITPPKESIE
jgi:hypothetical protein